MIITKEFVMLNFPKTGSSFARAVLRRYYRERNPGYINLLEKFGVLKSNVQELMLPKIDEELFEGIKDQHGTLRQIPREHQNKSIVSITRNPFSRYVSTYLYKWWEKYPPAEKRIILKQYPHFPRLSFLEHYEMAHRYGRKQRLRNIVPKIELGLHTIQFIQFYFKDPETILREIDSEYIENELYKDELERISFVHQERLKEELNAYLRNIGLNKQSLEFISVMERVNVTDKKRKDTEFQKYYQGLDIYQKILKRDRLLFKIFPEYLPDVCQTYDCR